MPTTLNSCNQTITQYNIQSGNASNSLNQIAPTATSGVPLISQGSSSQPVFGTAVVQGGGTGLTSATQGDLLYASAANTLLQLAKDTNATRYLSNTGTTNNPAWAQVALATGVSGTLPLANGGTNANLTASNGGIFYSTSTAGAILSGTATAGQLLRSGSSTAPTWTTSTYPTTNAVSTLLYASSANTMAALATANSAILNTNGSGVPSLATSPSVSGTITAGTGLTATTGAITASAGNVVVTAGNLTLPNTNSGGTNGVITLGGSRFVSNFGTSSTFVGSGSGNSSNTGSANVGIGTSALAAVTTGSNNQVVGYAAAQALTTGSYNSVLGYGALTSATNPGSTVAIGYQTLQNATNTSNTGVGTSCLTSLTSGEYNTVIGIQGGSAYTGTESSNVLLYSNGTVGDANTIRIGVQGSGLGNQNKCFIAGINGVTVTGTAVLCSTAGQLGTVASSERYKENIQSMPDDISVMKLRPIEFNYKTDSTKTKQYGLLAEDVDRDFPYLCFYNEDAQPESVKYHELCTFLLHEVQKLNKRIEQLEG